MKDEHAMHVMNRNRGKANELGVDIKKTKPIIRKKL